MYAFREQCVPLPHLGFRVWDLEGSAEVDKSKDDKIRMPIVCSFCCNGGEERGGPQKTTIIHTQITSTWI